MTRARSLLHAAGVFTATLAVGFSLTTTGAWLTAIILDSTDGMNLAGAGVVIGIAALGTIVTAGMGIALAGTTYNARRTS